MVQNQPNQREFLHRGDIYLVDFKKNEGSEQEGIRPALVLQNDTVIVSLPLLSYARSRLRKNNMMQRM